MEPELLVHASLVRLGTESLVGRSARTARTTEYEGRHHLVGRASVTDVAWNSLSFRYYPFTRWRTYRFEAIDAMELVEYNGLWEYGGWGIKWNGDSWSYTTGGKCGILVKTEGKKFLLGTHKPEEAKRAIAQFLAFKSSSSESELE